MAVVATIKIEGLSEVKDALLDLPKATGKNVMRRILKQRAQPIADTARNLAPVDTSEDKDKVVIRDSISVSTRLSKRQRREAKETKSYVEVYVGPTAIPHAHMQEFGTSKYGPQAYMRPAWDQNKGNVLKDIKEDLWSEISKAADRLARKAARAKG